MSDDVIIGYDGQARCAWVGADDTQLSHYHDEVWGMRTTDESAMFEALTLGVFEVGLSWSIVLGKRDAFRKAFHDFDVAKVAAMTDRDVDRLVENPAIIRNRAKIQATVDNARAMRSASPSLAALAKSYESTGEHAPGSISDIPSSTPQAEAFAKQLKSQGYRFVGPTSVYAFMQNVGVVNDHVRGCFPIARSRATHHRERPSPALDHHLMRRSSSSFSPTALRGKIQQTRLETQYSAHPVASVESWAPGCHDRAHERQEAEPRPRRGLLRRTPAGEAAGKAWRW